MTSCMSMAAGNRVNSAQHGYSDHRRRDESWRFHGHCSRLRLQSAKQGLVIDESNLLCGMTGHASSFRPIVDFHAELTRNFHLKLTHLLA